MYGRDRVPNGIVGRVAYYSPPGGWCAVGDDVRGEDKAIIPTQIAGGAEKWTREEGEGREKEGEPRQGPPAERGE